MNNLMNIATRIYDRPLLIQPQKASVILEVLSGRIGGNLDLKDLVPEGYALEIEEGEGGIQGNRFVGTHRREHRDFGFTKVQNGVAMITIEGTLVNRGAFIGTSSGLVSFEGIGAQVRDAAMDPEVHTILLDIDSPGGEATGMFATAELLREVDKRVVAFVNDVATSAAFGLASAADEIVVSQTSIVGSIGVVLVHLDQSKKLDEAGIKPTLIFAGAHKVDANSFGPLPEAVRADLQAEVMMFYDQFLETVALGRGDALDVEAARATEARTFIGADAVERGLADRVAGLDALMDDLIVLGGPTSGRSMQRKDRSMTLKHQAPAADASGETIITQAEYDAAISSARTEGHAAGLKEGAEAERKRIGSVTSHEAAKGREATALQMALETEMDAEAVSKVLATIPLEKPAAETPSKAPRSIEDRAAAEDEIGADADAGDDTPSAAHKSSWAKVIAKNNKQRGFAN